MLQGGKRQWKKDLTYFAVQGKEEHKTDKFGVLMFSGQKQDINHPRSSSPQSSLVNPV